MAKMNPYLNFDGTAEEAFNFYKSVFGGEFRAVHKMADMPHAEQLPENEKNRIMHIALPIDEHTVLMASDIMPSAGHKLDVGNNVYISLHPQSREEADHLFNSLSAGGVVEMAMADMFWGAYFGSFKDKYGILWMINFEHNQQ
ncbi:VOC family protein [Mucilaginibacter aquaedulcis]|uniref:VOC family protein n=1 Tax=Mucilaginibacter aquaedulcis TaxID=1187081 RepID=UPI0025B5F593|nr:VOC family protein [Mucilaginibacter aquaedulcis]MDN3548109.1 VOC family protein [Mucilaginibacter aquaedulcis]